MRAHHPSRARIGRQSRNHLEDNLSALAIKLSSDGLARIDAIVPIGAAAGTRYPEAQMSRVNV